MSETGKVGVHGVTERFMPESKIDLHVEEMRRHGITILPGLFSRDELAAARESLYRIYDKQVEEIGGLENLNEINDTNIVRSPLCNDEFFLKTTTQPQVMEIVHRLIGENVSLSSQVAVINSPNTNNYQEAWHRELQYQHFTSSRPLAVQAITTIDDFTFDNGATFFLLGSHLFEEFPSDEFSRNYEWRAEVPAGSAIIFNAMLYHRGAPNKTDRDRLGVLNLYTVPIIHQQIDFSNMLNGKYSDDPKLRQLLGYEWNPAPDVTAWRTKHLERKRVSEGSKGGLGH